MDPHDEAQGQTGDEAERQGAEQDVMQLPMEFVRPTPGQQRRGESGQSEVGEAASLFECVQHAKAAQVQCRSLVCCTVVAVKPSRTTIACTSSSVSAA